MLPPCTYDPTHAQVQTWTYENHSSAANKHLIVIHGESNQSPSGAPRLRSDGELAFYDDQFREVLNGYLAWKKAREKKGESGHRMMLMFNGGLNSSASVKLRAVTQADCLMRSGFYPVYMAWSTDALGTYAEQTAVVRNGKLYAEGQPTASLYFATDLASAAVRAPRTWTNELFRFFDSKGFFNPKAYSLKRDLADEEPTPPCRHWKEADGPRLCLPVTTAEGRTVLDDDPDLTFKKSLKAGWFYAALPLRMAFLGLLTDGGTEAWNNMLRRTRNTVHHPGEFQHEMWIAENLVRGSEETDAEWNRRRMLDRDRMLAVYPHGTGRFARFFEDLQACLETGTGRTARKDCLIPAGAAKELGGLRLILSGHSMGAIVINELLPHFHDLPYESVVFMAAATSVRHTRDSIVPFLDAKNGSLKPGETRVKFYNLMLHPKADAREDATYGLLSTGSLLEWIDEILEKPKTMLDRTIGKWRNLRRTEHVFLGTSRKDMTFKVFGFDQRNWDENLAQGCVPSSTYSPPEPTVHGAFNDNQIEFWCPTFWGESGSEARARGECWRSDAPPVDARSGLSLEEGPKCARRDGLISRKPDS